MTDQPSLFDGAPGMVGHRHPDTSLEAAVAVAPRTGTLRRRVLDFITAAGAAGATDDEIQAALAMEGNTERPRRLELVAAGLIVDSGRRRQSAGRARIVWTLKA